MPPPVMVTVVPSTVTESASEPETSTESQSSVIVVALEVSQEPEFSSSVEAPVASEVSALAEVMSETVAPVEAEATSVVMVVQASEELEDVALEEALLAEPEADAVPHPATRAMAARVATAPPARLRVPGAVRPERLRCLRGFFIWVSWWRRVARRGIG